MTIAASARQRFSTDWVSDARVFLVGHRGDDHIAGEVLGRQPLRRDHARGHARLHVVATAGVQTAVAYDRLERALHALHADGVEVAVQHQRAAPAAPSRDAHDAGATRGGLVDLNVQPGVPHPRRDVGRDLLLPRSARHEVRVHRIDRDERGQELRDALLAPELAGNWRLALRSGHGPPTIAPGAYPGGASQFVANLA